MLSEGRPDNILNARHKGKKTTPLKPLVGITKNNRGSMSASTSPISPVIVFQEPFNNKFEPERIVGKEAAIHTHCVKHVRREAKKRTTMDVKVVVRSTVLSNITVTSMHNADNKIPPSPMVTPLNMRGCERDMIFNSCTNGSSGGSNGGNSNDGSSGISNDDNSNDEIPDDVYIDDPVSPLLKPMMAVCEMVLEQGNIADLDFSKFRL